MDPYFKKTDCDFNFRIMKDKRRSRDAIRSLLDLMSENRSMQELENKKNVFDVTQGYVKATDANAINTF